jgi:hypothetical protein
MGELRGAPRGVGEQQALVRDHRALGRRGSVGFSEVRKLLPAHVTHTRTCSSFGTQAHPYASPGACPWSYVWSYRGLTVHSTWDGSLPPTTWLECHIRYGQAPLPQEAGGDEFLGEGAPRWGLNSRTGRKGWIGTPLWEGNYHEGAWLVRNRFGPDWRPVGRVACARRGCSGCCYCRGFNEPLPTYLQARCCHPNMATTLIWQPP